MMIRFFIFLQLLCFLPVSVFCADRPVQSKKLDQLLSVIENRYQEASFTADFFQESILKAMDMTDIAEGKATFKWPGMMYWTYEKPEKQLIITNGDDLWIYRPSDHQVMVGKSPDYFGKGKGGSFLTNISLLRTSFNVSWTTADDSLAPKSNQSFQSIVLIPHKKNLDFEKLYLLVSPKTGDIHELVTLNAYGDITRIQFKNVIFKKIINEDTFTFEIPKGTDVVQLEE
jgi:outer membrane lipoprotein carrier protein